MIFIDTSALYAAADLDDPWHSAIVEALARLIDEEEELLVHNYVLVEAGALLQRRLGLPRALALLRQTDPYRIHWITSEDHDDAVRLLAERNKRGLSLVDCASFVIMRRYGVTRALALDADFEAEGFERYPASSGR